ncbi:hypothetical protein LIA77_11428 [Sarocladium implicatum]|nr:hypothetical protein LIA77_11428 [Sarocladium implicatum]
MECTMYVQRCGYLAGSMLALVSTSSTFFRTSTPSTELIAHQGLRPAACQPYSAFKVGFSSGLGLQVTSVVLPPCGSLNPSPSLTLQASTVDHTRTLPGLREQRRRVMQPSLDWRCCLQGCDRQSDSLAYIHPALKSPVPDTFRKGLACC